MGNVLYSWDDVLSGLYSIYKILNVLFIAYGVWSSLHYSCTLVHKLMKTMCPQDILVGIFITNISIFYVIWIFYCIFHFDFELIQHLCGELSIINNTQYGDWFGGHLKTRVMDTSSTTNLLNIGKNTRLLSSLTWRSREIYKI